jgi:O-antigen ligase
LAAAATILAIAVFYLRKVLTLRNIIIFGLAVVIIGWVVVRTLGVGGDLFTMEKFQEHISNVFYGASYNERIATFDNAMVAWRDHPWLGIGVGGFGPYIASHPQYMPKDGWRIVNNEFLEVLAETGVVGLSFFFIFIVFLVVRTLKAILLTKDNYLRAVLVGLLGAFIGVLVQYQTFSTLYIMHVWFLIGFMVAVQNIVLGGAEINR